MIISQLWPNKRTRLSRSVISQSSNSSTEISGMTYAKSGFPKCFSMFTWAPYALVPSCEWFTPGNQNHPCGTILDDWMSADSTNKQTNFQNTVFPQIVSEVGVRQLFKGGNYSGEENIDVRICDNYSQAEINQGRKLLIIWRSWLRKLFKGGNYLRAETIRRNTVG